MKLKFSFLFSALFITATISAQNTISGSIKDTLQAPLSFANIILYEEGSNEAVTGITSNEEGNYQFINIKDGSYVIEVSVLGFETKKI